MHTSAGCCRARDDRARRLHTPWQPMALSSSLCERRRDHVANRVMLPHCTHHQRGLGLRNLCVALPCVVRSSAPARRPDLGSLQSFSVGTKVRSTQCTSPPAYFRQFYSRVILFHAKREVARVSKRTPMGTCQALVAAAHKPYRFKSTGKQHAHLTTHRIIPVSGRAALASHPRPQ